MQVQVRYFAAIRERIGRADEAVTLPDGATAADLLVALAALHPVAGGLFTRSRVAQANAFLDHGAALEAAPVDVIPPVSGG